MQAQKRIRDLGIQVGEFETGPRNLISDVTGVSVGHATIDRGQIHTGITLIFPTEDSVFARKCVAASYVQNGFGKTCGLVQVEELGSLETPIALTNTLNVGKAADALLSYVMETEAKAGRRVYTANPIVGECNDSLLNDIGSRAVGLAELRAAAETASADFQLGAVGGGRGTLCYGLKGGIGSASRRLELAGQRYTLGILVQTNFGSMRYLTVNGQQIGRQIEAALRESESFREDRGSVMMILATDLPLTSRQLHRILKRVPNGLARTGSYTGHGSGEIVIGFSTANRIEKVSLQQMQVLQEKLLDAVFRAAAEATEEAVLDSMYCAKADVGLDGKHYHALAEFL